MKRFSVARAIPLSFFSNDLYRDVAREWRGAGLLYLLLVTVLAAIPFLVGIQVRLWDFERREASVVLRQIPAISVRHGRVSANVPMPWVIHGRSGAALAIIDTLGQATELDSTRAVAMLTSNQLILRRNGVETRTYDLSRISRFDLDEYKATRWFHRFANWFTLAFAPFLLVGSYVYRLIQVLVFAVIALMLAALLKRRFGFAALMRLTAVAITPMLVIDAVRGALATNIPLWGLWSSLIVIAYLVMALRANQAIEAPAEGVTTPARPPA